MARLTAPVSRRLHKTESVTMPCPWCPASFEFKVVTKVNNYQHRPDGRLTQATMKAAAEAHDCPGPELAG